MRPSLFHLSVHIVKTSRALFIHPVVQAGSSKTKDTHILSDYHITYRDHYYLVGPQGSRNLLCQQLVLIEYECL